MTRKLRVLVDLKPALDGYSGIPQETRLLFESLARLPQVELTGLIQHGGRKLRRGLAAAGGARTAAEQIDAQSRAVVSLYEEDVHHLLRLLPRSWRKVAAYLNFEAARTLRGRLGTSELRAGHFGDFVWSNLFEKSLDYRSRQQVLAQRFELLAEPRIWLQRSGLLRRKKDTPQTSFPQVDTSGHDVFIAQTPFPGVVSPGTRLVVRYHDAVPIFWAHTIRDKSVHQSAHFLALHANVQAGAFFACTSESTRSDLVRLFPEVEARSAVIHNHKACAYSPAEVDRSAAIRLLQTLRRQGTSLSKPAGAEPAPADFPYLLMVSTFEPRKNHARLLTAWSQLKLTQRPDLRLVLVGSSGWNSEAVQHQLRPFLESGEAFHVENIPSDMLRVLYTHAAATVCPSLAEGFDYSGLEAMSCGSPVVASEIPVHREVYGDACSYFDPYSVQQLADCIQSVTGDLGPEQMQDLTRLGLERAAHYNSERSMDEWSRFLETLLAPHLPLEHRQ